MSIIYESTTEDYVDVTELFRFAQDFYLDHPGQQLELAGWEKRVANIGIPNDLWVVQVGEQAAEYARPTFIPVLAAISLGFPSKDLLAVMKHHDMDADDFLRCEYCKNLIPGVPHNPIDDTRVRLDSWTVCKAVLDAINLDADLTNDLILERNDEENYYEHDPDLEVVCLLSPIEGLWPISIPDSMIETSNLYVIDISYFEHANESFQQLSYEQVLTTLERSGNLHPLVISENGYSDGINNGFFKKLFVGMVGDGNVNLSKIIEALNSVDDPVLLDKLNTRIINALPDFDFEFLVGMDAMEMMAKYLDKTRYAPLLNNMVVKLNLLPLVHAKGLKKPQSDQVLIGWIEDYECGGSDTLQHLFNELMMIDPIHFRKPHFKAIGVAMNGLVEPQNLSRIDLQALLMKALHGFYAYSKAAHWTQNGLPTTTFVDKAKPSVETLASFVSKHVEVDYKALADLPSVMKALLAGCDGFDIRKLPGITRRDKGQVLSDGLGL
jgi:hypothetical protein